MADGPEPPASGALVFDFGLKHIGVATAEPKAHLARALTTVRARDGVPQWEALDRVVADWRPEVLVVGLPLNMDGTPSEISAAARRFGARLGGRYALPVEFADERLSTFEAVSRGGNEDAAHALAAEVIGETWLDDRLGKV
ncbi:MAG: Holliday junction resolvase RuvX [Gammaproteobacteria bacterium]|nr:Holliday junction resolvase RuvX [Gammaproteobacteria bacterium]